MSLFEVEKEVRIEFEESPIHKEQITCDIIKVDGNILVLDSSNMSPYYFQYLYEGREIKIFLYGMHGINIFDSVIITAPTDGRFEVEVPENYESIQRRQFVRADIELNLTLIAMNEKVTAKTIDIAGNGIRFITRDRPQFGNKYKFTLFLPGTNAITGIGSIVKIKDIKKGEYILEFNDITENSRDKIIKLCLNIQSRVIKEKKNSII